MADVGAGEQSDYEIWSGRSWRGGVMPASPRGLLSDRSMAASSSRRLRFGRGPPFGAGEIGPLEVSLGTITNALECQNLVVWTMTSDPTEMHIQ